MSLLELRLNSIDVTLPSKKDNYPFIYIQILNAGS